MQAGDIETVSWLRVAFASTTVIGLMALLAWALKYFAQRGWIKPRAEGARVSILSSHPIDARRRLVIARCDETEYHLLLGPSGDLLLSSRPASPPPPASSAPSS